MVRVGEDCGVMVREMHGISLILEAASAEGFPFDPVMSRHDCASSM